MLDVCIDNKRMYKMNVPIPVLNISHTEAVFNKVKETFLYLKRKLITAVPATIQAGDNFETPNVIPVLYNDKKRRKEDCQVSLWKVYLKDAEIQV